MAWTIEYGPAALRALRKLDRQTVARIAGFMTDRVAGGGNPRDHGKALVGSFRGQWRYRVGDHRVICNIDDARGVILILDLGDRKDVYR